AALTTPTTEALEPPLPADSALAFVELELGALAAGPHDLLAVVEAADPLQPEPNRSNNSATSTFSAGRTLFATRSIEISGMLRGPAGNPVPPGTRVRAINLSRRQVSSFSVCPSDPSI